VNSTNIKLFIGCMLFVTWVLLVVFKVLGAEDIITAIKLCLAGLGAYHLNDRVNAPPAPPIDKQAGRAQAGMLVLLAAAALALSGCAGFQQALGGYEAAALAGAQASNDNIIRVWSTAACATPFSAAIRNPQVIPALKALCLPGGDATNPGSLLDAAAKPK
jgi:hypothetical protein